MRLLRISTLAASLIFAGACAGGDNGGSGPLPDFEEGVAPAEVAGAAAPGESASGLVALAADRAIVYTAELGLKVDDVGNASDRAIAIAEGNGGFLAAQELDPASETLVAGRATVTLRVPATAFRAVLDALSDLGDVSDRSVDAADVTDQIVDLEARLTSARASLERVRELFERATNVSELAALEAEVSARETAVEQLQAQLASVQEDVALATVTVRMGEGEPPPPPGKDPEPADGIPGFVSGLKHGWVALVNVGAVAATVTGAVLPWLPLLVGAAYVAIRVRRRRMDPATGS